jgi:hypothetical protein
LTALGRPWRRWTAVVELFAQRRRRHRLGPAEYEELYQELLAACQAPADADASEKQTYVRGLEEFVRPWMTLRVLEQADRDILLDLAARCRRIDLELNGRDWRAAARAWLWPAVVGLASAFLIAVAIYAVSGMSRPLNDWFDDEWRTARIVIQEATTVQRIMAIGVIALPLTAYLVHHVRKA